MRAAYLSLTEDEKAEVKNALTLENKISDLSAVMGVNPDFSLTYEEHFPEAPEEPETPEAPEPPADEPDGEDDDGTLMLVIIISASVVGAAVIAFAVVFFLKKRAHKNSDSASHD